jgi:23S rRNA (adenine2503-C2)-methyltransferase
LVEGVEKVSEALPASPERVNLLDMLPVEAEAAVRSFAAARGQPAYRAQQVLQHLWKDPRASFEEMSELPRPFRSELDSVFEIPRLGLSARQKSLDGTEKFLFRLSDGEHIETV